jgi:hypothetical protein
MPIPVGTGIVGPASTGQLTGQFDLLPDVQRDVTFYDLQSAIIMTFLMAINRTEKASQPLFNWKEDQADYPSYTCTSAIPITAAGTPFTMTVSYGRVVPGDTVTEPYSNQTFEWQTISSQNATTTVGTVLQVPSTVATTAVAGGALLINQGMHMVEGGAFPQGIGQIPLNVSNITAIKAGAVEVTYSMFNSETFWGNEYEYNKRARITQWRGDMERDLIWGKLVQEQRTQTSNGFTVTNQMRQSLGILGRITSNKDVYTPPVSEGTLNNFVRQTVWGSRNSGSRQKLGACGPLLMGGIDDVAITASMYRCTWDTAGASSISSRRRSSMITRHSRTPCLYSIQAI